MNSLIKVLSIPVLLIGVFFVYSLVSYLVLTFIPGFSMPRTYTHMILVAVLASVAVSVVYFYPIVKIYKSLSTWVAIVCCLSIWWFRVPDVINYWTTDKAIANMGLIESALILLLPAAVFLYAKKNA